MPDKLGRIVIPANPREYAGLTGEVVVAGVHSRVESWDKATWDAEQERVDEESAAPAEQIRVADDPPAGVSV